MNSAYVRLLASLVVALTVVACSPLAAPETTDASSAGPSTATSAPGQPAASATLIPPTSALAPATSISAPGDVEKSSPAQSEVPMGFTEDGTPYRGDPNAPVTLMEYSEFQ